MADKTSSLSPTKNRVGQFSSDANGLIPQSPSYKSKPEAEGLSLIDSLLNQEKSDGSLSNPINRMCSFGPKLQVQISAIHPQELGLSSESPVKRQLSLKEMVLSEDYTCVITHGPNPKTTHIFDNCIVGSCCGEDNKISDDTQS